MSILKLVITISNNVPWSAWHIEHSINGTLIVNFITRKQQNQKVEPTMKQLWIEWILLKQEIKLYENN